MYDYNTNASGPAYIVLGDGGNVEVRSHARAKRASACWLSCLRIIKGLVRNFVDELVEGSSPPKSYCQSHFGGGNFSAGFSSAAVRGGSGCRVRGQWVQGVGARQGAHLPHTKRQLGQSLGRTKSRSPPCWPRSQSFQTAVQSPQCPLVRSLRLAMHEIAQGSLLQVSFQPANTSIDGAPGYIENNNGSSAWFCQARTASACNANELTHGHQSSQPLWSAHRDPSFGARWQGRRLRAADV